MQPKLVLQSKEFRQHTARAIGAIVFFIFSYLLILVLTFAITALCVILGGKLIGTLGGFYAIVIGLALASIGLMISFFVLKFIFRRHKTDRSHLIEITASEQPELFRLIGEIVTAVGTRFPKKVYISEDVNASVFYDSGFWSMFLPVRKNLIIGMGFVNTSTEQELKAILAHEFGHFSQRTMKLGSYVYNVNQVIFNSLYDNQSYDKLIIGWGNIHWVFSLASAAALKIIAAIQWVLRKLYEVVNKITWDYPAKWNFMQMKLQPALPVMNRLKSFCCGRLWQMSVIMPYYIFIITALAITCRAKMYTQIILL